MNYLLSCKHLDFVSYMAVKNGSKGFIHVFSHKKNGKMKKKKVYEIGAISKYPKTKLWTFIPVGNWCYSAENMIIISNFLYRLDNKTIILNKNGELELL